MRNCSGFTLLELMAVVLILGLLLGTAMPNVVDMVQQQQLRSETRQLVSNLRKLQQEAITTEEKRGIQFSSTGTSYRVADIQYHLQEGITYKVSPNVLGTINYNSMGALEITGNITVEFVDTGGHRRQVILRPSGRISTITP